MKAVSSKWLRTITGSYTPFYRATVLDYFQTGTAPVGTRVPIVDGKVTLDGAADIYATGALDIPGSYWPDPHGEQLVAPYGPEVFVQAGILYRDDLVETKALGYFRIKRAAQRQATTAGAVALDLSDRMAGIARATFLAPRAYAATMTNGQLATALVSDVYPLGTIEWDDAAVRDAPIGRDIVVEEDRHGALKSLALSTGKIMRFDGRGVLTFRTVLNVFEAPVAARLVSGRNGLLVEASRELSDEGVVNAVVARGDGADEIGAAYGLSIDLDPNSPTRYDGPFGPSPLYLTSSLITSNDVAVIAANAERTRRQGLPHTVNMEFSPRHDLEPDDLVQVEHTYGVGWHFLASLEIPLIAGARMSGVSRLQYVQFGVVR